MRPQLHSPPMLPRRLIGSCLAVVAAALVMLGCGSSGDPVQVDLPAETVTGVNAKLDQIQERFTAGKCTGPNSATSSLDSLKTAVNSLEVDQQFIDDMNEMLDNLAKRIDDQCEPSVETTTTDTTPETTDTLPTTTTPPLTDTTTTTTTDTTKDTTTTTTTTAPEPPTGPPGNPDNPNGNGPGGGVIPGGGNKKEKPKSTGNKDEGGKPKKDKDPNR
jgi:hypothetical protein